MGHRSAGASWERVGGIGIEFAPLPMRVQPVDATIVCARRMTIGVDSTAEDHGVTKCRDHDPGRSHAVALGVWRR